MAAVRTRAPILYARLVRPAGRGRGGGHRGALGRTAGAPPPIHGQATLFSGPGRTPPRHPDPRTRSSASRSRHRRPAALPTTGRFLFTSIFTARDAFADGRVPPRRRRRCQQRTVRDSGGRAGGRTNAFFDQRQTRSFSNAPTVFAAIVTSVFSALRVQVYFLLVVRSGSDDFVNVFVLRLCPLCPPRPHLEAPGRRPQQGKNDQYEFYPFFLYAFVF